MKPIEVNIDVDRGDILLRRKFLMLTEQLPVLYAILIINTSTLAYTHATAPVLLSRIIPAVMCFACFGRLLVWMRRKQHISAYTDKQIDAFIRSMLILTNILGIVFTGWSLTLFPYGSAYSQAHVAVFLATTVIGCAFCLSYIRTAAISLLVTCVGPLAIFITYVNHREFTAIAISVTSVSAGMIYIVLRYSRDFVDLVKTQFSLEKSGDDLKKLSAENERLANTDALTKLPNRRQFVDSLGKFILESKANHTSFALALFDLDGFKSVNDLYGHSAGDCVLKEAGRRFGYFAGEHCLIARLGGDEFGMLFSVDRSSVGIDDTATAICMELGNPYATDNAVIRVSCSSGIAIFPTTGTTESELLEHADYALYFAKQNTKGNAIFFADEHRLHMRELSKIEQCLRQSDLEAELSLHFQPIIDAVANEIIGYEALARWRNDSLGNVSPALFIKVAERSDLIHLVTNVLLGKLKRAMQVIDPKTRVSFNLSARTLASTDAMSTLTRSLQGFGGDIARLTLEVTETAMILDFERARIALLQLKELGVRISLDDFGTGYSSLRNVHQLPLDIIKIDRSFVSDVTDNRNSQQIVTGILGLCKSLGLTCIIEGVETSEQAGLLIMLGGKFMQGFYFGRPEVPRLQPLRLALPDHETDNETENEIER